MKIAFLTHADRIGGAETSLLELAHAVRQAGHSVAIGAPPGSAVLDAAPGECERWTIAVPRLDVRSWRRPRTLLALRRAVRDLRRRLHLARPDLIHANSLSAQCLAAQVAPRSGIPSIWNLRDLRYPSIFARWAAARSTRILVPSAACARSLESSTGARHIDILPNAIPLPKEPRALTELPAPPTVVSISTLAPWKRIDYLVRSVPLVLARRAEVRFRVVGDDRFGDDPNARERLARLARSLNVERAITFEGWSDSVHEVLAECVLLVHPADDEPFGRVLIEAMAMARPVVAVGRAGPAEIVVDGETGTLVESSEPESIARGILSALEDPAELARRGRNARARFERHYTMERLLPRYLELARRAVLEDTRSPIRGGSS